MDWLVKKDKKKEHFLDHYYYEKEKAELSEDDEKLLEVYNNAKDYAKVYKGENIMYEGIATYNDESVYLSTETLKKVMPKIKGRPVLIEHKAGITPNNMEKYAVGYVTGAEYNNETGRFDVDFVVWNDEAKELLDNKGFTLSTSYIAKEFANGACCINTPYENEITDLDFTHLAIVKNPRYEKVKVYENSKEEGEYGDVKYADIGYQEDKKPRYPIDTEEHVRAALSYFGMPKNRAKYTKEQIEKIQARIDKAKEKFKIGEEKENGFITLDEVDEKTLKEMEEKNKKARKRAEKQNCIINLKEEYNMEKIEVSRGFMAGLLNLAGKVFNNACKDEEIEEINDKIEEKDDKKTDKKDEKKNDKVDKRKLIDEVGGILKGKVDEETWRTVIGKIEKASYDEPDFKGDEKDKKDNKKEEKQNSVDYYEMMNAKVNALQKAPEKHYSSFDALQNGAEIYGKKGV